MKIQQWLFQLLRKQSVTDGHTDGRTDNVKTVYPLQTKFAGGINMKLRLGIWMSDPYLYYNSIKDTPVCGHLDFNCLELKYEVKVWYLDE